MPDPIKSTIKAFANCDHVIIAWKYEQPVPNCIGFALYKKLGTDSNATSEPLSNRIGFAGQTPQPGEQRPSTEWPIQRLLWTDFDVKADDTVSYMIIPMFMSGTDVVKDTANASAWSNTVTVATGKDIEVYFNRGIISSQFMSRQMAAIQAKDKTQTLKSTLNDESSAVTQFLGGALIKKLTAELTAVVNDPTLSIYASLYELNDGMVIDAFKKIGKRLSLVLANGAFKGNAPGDNDENAALRAELHKTDIQMVDRIVTLGHFAHNKFMVFCKDGKPYKVWTGSTNLSQNGLYTQVNNAVLINDPEVGQWYLDEWNQIKAAANDYPADFISYNTKGNSKKDLSTWFAPVAGQVDLAAAKALIDNAKQGILFLFFNPGTAGTLYNEVMAQIGAPGKDHLFVHGIMNQDPGGTKTPIVFIHKGDKQSTDYDTLIPKAIGGEFSYWSKEISPKMVTIHSKVVIIDPYGDHPVVMTGSHNLGPKASGKNDDNLNIIVNNPSVASQFAVNILAVYDHFHWRYSLANGNKGAKGYSGLSTDPKWMESYQTGNNVKEIDFLLGNIGTPAETVPTPATPSTPAVVPNPILVAPPVPNPGPIKPADVSTTPVKDKIAPAKPIKKAAAKVIKKVADKKIIIKAAAKKAPVKKAATKKVPAKQAPAKKVATKKAPAKKAVAKKAAGKAAIKKVAVKKASPKKSIKKAVPAKKTSKASKTASKKPAAIKKAGKSLKKK